MSENADSTCKECRFLGDCDEEDGVCRRYPPKVILTDEGEATAFPVVDLTWWCGEFSRRVN